MTIANAAELMRRAVARFNEAVFENAESDQLERQATLAGALDGLVEVYNGLPDCGPDELPDAPRSSHEFYMDLYERVGGRFPNLGYYPDVDVLGDTEQKIGLADAIDDIADIARDLRTVLWYLDNDRVETAIWQYKFDFRLHWGEHLLRMRRLLHHSLHY
jgi:Domain of unknown function (DUF5063)